MTDRTHTLVLVNVIVVLVFTIAMTALTQHPEWFGSCDACQGAQQ